MIDYEMTADDYHARDEVSNSQLQHAGRSVAHMLEAMANPPDSEAMAFGRAVHSLVLDGEDVFAQEYVWPTEKVDGRTKAGKAWLAKARDTEQTVLRFDDYWSVRSVYNALQDHPHAMDYLRGEDVANEVSVTAADDYHDNVGIRARFDAWHPKSGLLVDLKTTRDASPESFERSIHRFGYDQQWAFYDRVLHAATGEHLDQFVIVAVEKDPPYGVACYELSLEWLYRGREIVQANLAKWSRYLTTGESGYPTATRILQPPAYL